MIVSYNVITGYKYLNVSLYAKGESTAVLYSVVLTYPKKREGNRILFYVEYDDYPRAARMRSLHLHYPVFLEAVLSTLPERYGVFGYMHVPTVLLPNCTSRTAWNRRHACLEPFTPDPVCRIGVFGCN